MVANANDRGYRDLPVRKSDWSSATAVSPRYDTAMNGATDGSYAFPITPMLAIASSNTETSKFVKTFYKVGIGNSAPTINYGDNNSASDDENSYTFRATTT